MPIFCVVLSQSNWDTNKLFIEYPRLLFRKGKKSEFLCVSRVARFEVSAWTLSCPLDIKHFVIQSLAVMSLWGKTWYSIGLKSTGWLARWVFKVTWKYHSDIEYNMEVVINRWIVAVLDFFSLLLPSAGPFGAVRHIRRNTLPGQQRPATCTQRYLVPVVQCPASMSCLGLVMTSIPAFLTSLKNHVSSKTNIFLIP